MIDFVKTLLDDDITRIGLSVVGYMFVYLIGNKVINWALDIISKKLDKDALHWKFIRQAAKGILIFIVIFGIAYSVPVFEKFITALVASSAVIVAAVGLASQESMANLVSGMFISIFKPFEVGDRIKIASSGLVGMIEDINLRHTVIRTIENNRIIVPNTTMNKEVIENSNYQDVRICNFLDIKISYSSDIEKARTIIKEELISHPNFIDWRNETEKQDNVDLVNVLVRDISNNCVELRAGVWTADIATSFRACSDLRAKILIRFKSEGIEIYYQTIKLVEPVHKIE